MTQDELIETIAKAFWESNQLRAADVGDDLANWSDLDDIYGQNGELEGAAIKLGFIHDAEAALAAVEAAGCLHRQEKAAGEWRTMESADRSREILALSPDYCNGTRPLILRWFKYNGAEAWRDWDNDAHQPTHWRHLPDPPAT